ncbi:MAG: hypothetical protein AB7V46_12665 [Thermomicrobiales bacterium]
MKRYFRFLLLLSTLALLPAQGMGMGAAAQTPKAETIPERETVIDITVDGQENTASFVGIARLTFPPGTAIIGGTIAGNRLFLIESGFFTFVVDSPAVIHQQGDPEREIVVASGASGEARPGDLVIVTGNPPFTVTNEDSAPSVLLDIVIWPPIREQVRPFVTEAGVIFEPLVIGDVELFPSSAVRIVLEHYSLARDARTTLEPAEGPLLLYIDSGRLGLHSTGGEMSYSSAAANAPGSIAGRIRELSPGREAVLTAGGAAVLHSGSSGIARNLGRTALDIMELRFEPA